MSTEQHASFVSEEAVMDGVRTHNNEVLRILDESTDETRALIQAMLQKNVIIMRFGIERYQAFLEKARPTRTEEAMFEMLIAQPGTPISHETFTEQLWPGGQDAESNNLAVHMNRLREKMSKANLGKDFGEIVTIRKRGYALMVDAQA